MALAFSVDGLGVRCFASHLNGDQVTLGLVSYPGDPLREWGKSVHRKSAD